MKKKVCSFCENEKEISLFSRKSASPDGYMSYCKECRSKIELEYRTKNKEKVAERRKKYYENNKKKHLDYFLMKRNSDPLFRLKDNIRRRINFLIKKIKLNKSENTFNIVGCNPEQLKVFIESKFVENMTWENYGEWHIDHIVPLCAASCEEDILKLCHYSNLQPLWAKDNLSKGSKII